MNNKYIEIIPTGIDELDDAIGIGGLPRGRVLEIFGKASSGKTALSLMLIKQVLDKNGIAVYIDAECSFNKVYAKKLGIDLDKLMICPALCGEETLETLETMLMSNSVDLIVVDSVASIIPLKQKEGKLENCDYKELTDMMYRWLSKIMNKVRDSKTCVVFLNQVRMGFNNNITTPGGKALKFYSSLRIELIRKNALKKNFITIGQRVLANIVRNKFSVLKDAIEFDIFNEKGLEIR